MPEKSFSHKFKVLLLAFFFIGGLLYSMPAKAVAGFCYCYLENDFTDCFVVTDQSSCNTTAKRMTGGEIPEKCLFFAGERPACNGARDDKIQFTQAREVESAKAEKSAGGIMTRLIPADLTECINKPVLAKDDPCRSVDIFIKLAINLATFLFGIVGALALAMLVYGGFTMILSMGNPEKTKKGMGILVAAVLGLVIVFGAYILVNFLQTTILTVG